MRYIEDNTKSKNTENGDLSFFNRIKRSSLVWSDDAVETIKCHGENEEGAAQCGGEGHRDS